MKSALSSRPGPDLRLVGLVVLLAIIVLVVKSAIGHGGEPFFGDTDDAMRMAVVRDFLAGQGWYDLTSHRLNTPFGAEIHWSRLVDVALAAILLVLTPLLGSDLAMVVTGYVWPMLLLAAVLWLSARLAHRLVGPEGVLPALILPVLSPAITAEFTPGRVDHHSLVILLTLAMAWAGVESVQRPRFAILGGLLVATALAIATESLPTIAAAIIVAGLLFVFDAGRAATMRRFGLAFAIGAAIHLALYRPPSRWLEAACDVLSPVYVGVALVVALVFTVASFVPAGKPWQRFLLLAVPGLMGMALIAWFYPQCLKGPYGALDPWLQDNWIANIVEAKPWIDAIVDLPAYVIAVSIPALVGAGVVLYRLWHIRQDRAEWAVLLVFLLFAAIVMLAQIRGARLSVLPAMPAAAWLIVTMRHRYLASQRLGNILALVGSWLIFSGIILAVLVAVVTKLFSAAPTQIDELRATKGACLLPGAFIDLAALPPERIMAPIDLGAHLLLYTPHEVVAAPYHRNQQGVRDAFRFFNDPIADARVILDARGIGLVVLCPAMPEVRGLPARAADSSANLYAEDRLPDWLVDVSLPDSPLEVFAVLPQ